MRMAVMIVAVVIVRMDVAVMRVSVMIVTVSMSLAKLRQYQQDPEKEQKAAQLGSQPAVQHLLSKENFTTELTNKKFRITQP